MADRPKVGGSLGAGGIAAVLVWLWGMWKPDTPLPPEAAAAFAAFIGGIYGPVKRKIDRWLAA